MHLRLVESAAQLLFANLGLNTFWRAHWGLLHSSKVSMALIALHCFIGTKVVVVVPSLGVISDTVEVVVMSCGYYIDLLISQYWSLYCIGLNNIFLFLEGWCPLLFTRF